MVLFGPEATRPETNTHPSHTMAGENVCRAVNPHPGSIFEGFIIGPRRRSIPLLTNHVIFPQIEEPASQ
jgi:hypothetical protein